MSSRQPVRWVGPIPTYLTRPQVARLMGVTVCAVYQRDFPAETILGTVMIPVAALVEKGIILIDPLPTHGISDEAPR